MPANLKALGIYLDKRPKTAAKERKDKANPHRLCAAKKRKAKANPHRPRV